MSRVGQRRAPALVAGLALWLGSIGILAGSAAAAASTTFRDSFASVSYGGNDGSAEWDGNWVELGESDGPAAGKVSVRSDSRCASGSCGYLSASGNATVGMLRAADLSAATSATLTFSHRRTKVGNDPALVRVSVSGDGGGSWSTVAVLALDASDDAQLLESLGISSWISPETVIRFRAESTPGQGGRFYFDNVQITAELADPPTTTTTSQPPATTTTTTSTTQPPGSTTTSTQPPPSTTTTAPPPTPTLGPPDPAAPPTSVAAPPTTTEAAPTTTLGPVALPPTNPISVRSPFPVDLSAGTESLAGATTVAITQVDNLAVADRDVSSLLVVALGDPISVSDLRVRAAQPGHTAGGFSYVWPGLVIVGALAVAALYRRPVVKRPSQ